MDFAFKQSNLNSSLVFLHKENIWKKHKLPSELMLKENYSQLIFVPINLRGQTIGTIIVGTLSEKDALDTDDIKFIETLGDTIATALETTRLVENSQRRASREWKANEISSKLFRNSEDIQDILEILHNEIMQQLGDHSSVYSFLAKSTNNKTLKTENEVVNSMYKSLTGKGDDFLKVLSKSSDLDSIKHPAFIETSIPFHQFDIKMVIVCPLQKDSTVNTGWIMFSLFSQFNPLSKDLEEDYVSLIHDVCTNAAHLIEKYSIIKSFSNKNKSM